MSIDIKHHSLDQIIQALHEKLLEVSSDNVVKAEFVFTCEGEYRSYQTVGAEFLKANNKSMRNLRGDFIK